MKKVITIIIAIIIISAILVGCGSEEQNIREQALQEASSISSEIKKMDYIENRVNNSIPENLKLYIDIDKTFAIVNAEKKSFSVSIYPKEASLFPIVGDYAIKELDKIIKEDDNLNEYDLDITFNSKNTWYYHSNRKSGVFAQGGEVVSPSYTLEDLKNYYKIEVKYWKKDLGIKE